MTSFLYTIKNLSHTNYGDNMKDNIDYLNYVYQNARMGVVGIENIEDKVESEELKKIIKEQLEDYETICERAIDLYLSYNQEEKDINALVKINTYINAKISLLGKEKDKEIAKMMIKGSNIGIIEITEKINKYEYCDERVKTLAKQLLKIEERNLEKLKPYL